MPLRAMLLAAIASPCIWDSDTVANELRGVPEAYELIMGRWHRHSEAYYRHRIETLPGRLERSPDDLGAYDDLAVAYERLKDRATAIQVIQKKAAALKRRPDRDHEYRYHANLGTFLAHDGRFEEAIPELEKAVAIHPDAHFGRERFQIDWIRYFPEARKNPALIREHNFLSWSGYQIGYLSNPIAAMSFTTPWPSGKRPAANATWDEAYVAVSSILRWGGGEGADVYRVLGDIHLLRDGMNLAWLSYQRALEKGHPAKDRIEASIRLIEERWSQVGHRAPLIRDYQGARAAADRWVAAYTRLETEAVAAGRDPSTDAEMRVLRAAADREAGPLPMVWAATGRPVGQWGLMDWTVTIIAVLVLASMCLLKGLKRLNGRALEGRLTRAPGRGMTG